MKKYATVLLVVLFLFGCAGMRVVPSNEFRQEKILKISHLNKDEIFEMSKMWMAKNFKSAKSVLEYESKEKGIIIGNGSVYTAINGGLSPIGAIFTMQLDIKDGKVRIRIDNVQQAMGYPLQEVHKQAIVNQLTIMIDSLERYLQTSERKEDW